MMLDKMVARSRTNTSREKIEISGTPDIKHPTTARELHDSYNCLSGSEQRKYLRLTRCNRVERG